MNALKNKVNNTAIFMKVCGMQVQEKVKSKLKERRGDGFIEVALTILISVVVGALLLAGLYTLFKDTLLPTLTQKIKDLFDYKG